MTLTKGLDRMGNSAPDLFDQWLSLWQAPAEAILSMTEAATGAMTSLFRVNMGDVTVYFPFGNGYTQQIEPATNWGWIGETATDRPDVEMEITRDVASYGKQIGRMMELLLDLADKVGDADPEKLEQVAELQRKIAGVKAKLDAA